MEEDAALYKIIETLNSIFLSSLNFFNLVSCSFLFLVLKLFFAYTE